MGLSAHTFWDVRVREGIALEELEVIEGMSRDRVSVDCASAPLRGGVCVTCIASLVI